jgi:hypothetical protein
LRHQQDDGRQCARALVLAQQRTEGATDRLLQSNCEHVKHADRWCAGALQLACWLSERLSLCHLVVVRKGWDM